MNTIKESDYWLLNNNCKLNITIQFIDRNFDKEINKNKNEDLKEEIKNIQNPEHDYLQHIDRPICILIYQILLIKILL